MVKNPVIDAVFPTGSELILWNPHRDRHWPRVARTLACGLPTLLAAGAEAVSVMVLISHADSAPATVVFTLCTVAGALLIVIGSVRVWVECACFEYDHCHRPGTVCGLERRPGEFFYRPSDFATLNQSMVERVERILRDLKELHDSTARNWLPPGLLEVTHRLVWNTMTTAYATADARRATEHARDHDDLTGLADTIARELSTLDRHLGQIGDHLHEAAWLTRAWAHKLDRVQERDALHAQLASVSVGSLDNEVTAAREISEATFTWLTAARDLLGAGSFAWEHETSHAA